MVEEIVREAKYGSKDAFGNLVIAYQNDLYKIAKCRLNSEDDVCDAVQETLISAYQSISTLKNEKYFKTWLIKILINKCNDIYKKNKGNVVSIENIPIVNNEYIEEKSDIDFFNLIKDFNVEERTILTLYYSEGYKSKEISKMLNINSATVRTKLRRMKLKLEEILKKEEEYNEQIG